MKNLKNEKGGITILVLVSVLFMVAFLISSYVIISNKVQAQKEIVSQTKEIYESKKSMEEIYNSYFNTENFIPIYTEEQLMMIGEEHRNVFINGKYYNFNNEESTIYKLMDDIEINSSDYEGQAFDKWKNESLNAKFFGNGHKISVIYTDSVNQEETYTVVYSQESKYQEPSYEIKITALNSVQEDITEYVTFYIEKNEELEQINKNENDEYIIQVTRLQEVIIVAKADGFEDAERVIYIENPNKMESEIALILGQFFSFSVIPTPVDAIVTINGEQTNSVQLLEGETVNWNVSRNYYYEQSGTYTLGRSNYRQNITLSEKPSNTLTLNPNSVTPSTTGSFKTAAATANKGVDVSTGDYARATGDAYLQWNFTDFSDIDENARIDSITVYYRIAAAWSMGASVEIKAGSTTCLSKTYDSVYWNLISGSQKYTETITSLPTAKQLKEGFTIKVTKGNTSNSYHFRWYGATIEVTYTNP